MEEENKNQNEDEIIKTEVVEKDEIVAEENGSIDNSKGDSIAALILGIISIVPVKIPTIISIACGIIAIIIGLKEYKKTNNKMAQAGFILGIIGIVLSAITIILVIMAAMGIVFSIFHRLIKI